MALKGALKVYPDLNRKDNRHKIKLPFGIIFLMWRQYHQRS